MNEELNINNELVNAISDLLMPLAKLRWLSRAIPSWIDDFHTKHDFIANKYVIGIEGLRSILNDVVSEIDGIISRIENCR